MDSFSEIFRFFSFFILQRETEADSTTLLPQRDSLSVTGTKSEELEPKQRGRFRTWAVAYIKHLLA